FGSVDPLSFSKQRRDFFANLCRNVAALCCDSNERQTGGSQRFVHESIALSTRLSSMTGIIQFDDSDNFKRSRVTHSKIHMPGADSVECAGPSTIRETFWRLDDIREPDLSENAVLRSKDLL